MTETEIDKIFEPKTETLDYFQYILDFIWSKAKIDPNLQTETARGTMPLKEKALISLWSEHCKVLDEIKELVKQKGG